MNGSLLNCTKRCHITEGRLALGCHTPKGRFGWTLDFFFWNHTGLKCQILIILILVKLLSCVKYLIVIKVQIYIKLDWCVHTCPYCSGFCYCWSYEAAFCEAFYCIFAVKWFPWSIFCLWIMKNLVLTYISRKFKEF